MSGWARLHFYWRKRLICRILIIQPGIIAGDLYVRVLIKDHKVYERRGADLFITQKISLLNALTGVTFELTQLDGKKFIVSTAPGEVISHSILLITQSKEKQWRTSVCLSTRTPCLTETSTSILKYSSQRRTPSMLKKPNSSKRYWMFLLRWKSRPLPVRRKRRRKLCTLKIFRRRISIKILKERLALIIEIMTMMRNREEEEHNVSNSDLSLHYILLSLLLIFRVSSKINLSDLSIVN